MARDSKCWLVKTEPESYSIQDLNRERNKTTYWDGVRNYQARNFLRDQMKLGDRILIYHSNADPTAVVGVGSIVRESYPDFTATDPKNPHYDPQSTTEDPRWYMVDIKLDQIFAKPLTLDMLRGIAALKKMELLRRGSRLSVQPVRPDEFRTIMKLAGE